MATIDVKDAAGVTTPIVKPGDTQAIAGSDASKANAVQGITGGKPVPVSGPVTDAQLRATAVPVSGTFWQATQPVSGTFWQATQPVSGPLTDTQLRATAIPVTGPLTDTQLRTSAVAVSGPLTDAQLRATAVPVTGTFSATTTVKATASDPTYGEGSTTNPLSTDLSGKLRVTGSFSASSAVKATAADPSYTEGSTTNPVSTDLAGYQRVIAKQSGSYAVTGPLTDAQLRSTAVPVSGTFWQTTQPVSGPLTDTQLRATAVPVSGAIAPNVKAMASDPSYTEGSTTNPVSTDLAGYQRVVAKQTGTYAVSGPLTDTQLRASAVPVSGGWLTDTQLRATPVPVSGTVTATGPLTDTQLRASSVPVSGTFWQATQPVSGTITANAGTGNFGVNAVQINGVTRLTGNGVTGTGSPRVTIASDNTAFTVNAAQSGTWTVTATGPLTDTQLRATAVPVTVSGVSTAALQGAQGTGSTYNPPTGGSGEIGHLSGVYAETKANGVKLDTLHADIISTTPSAVYGAANFVDVTLSTDTAAYAAGDLLADTQAVAAAVRANDALGMLQSISIIDEADQAGVAIDLYFLSANNTFGTENAVPSITDANAGAILGYVRIATSDWIDLGGVKISSKPNVGIMVKPASGGDTVYVAAVLSAGTPTFTATSLKLRLGFLS